MRKNQKIFRNSWPQAQHQQFSNMADMHNIYKDSWEAMIVAEMVRSHSFLLSYNTTTENIHLKLFETVKNMHRSSAENKQESRAYYGICKNYPKNSFNYHEAKPMKQSCFDMYGKIFMQ